MANIAFKKLVEQEYAKFREDVKDVFSIAVIETWVSGYSRLVTLMYQAYWVRT